jgi:hypothetical protein
VDPNGNPSLFILYIFGFYTDAVSSNQRLHGVEWQDNYRIMNWEGQRGKQLWLKGIIMTSPLSG